jgi:hypothetical protein
MPREIRGALQAFADGFAWIAERFAGEPAATTCR